MSDFNLKYASRSVRLFHKAKKAQLERELKIREIEAYREACEEITGHNFGAWTCTICGEYPPKTAGIGLCITCSPSKEEKDD